MIRRAETDTSCPGALGPLEGMDRTGPEVASSKVLVMNVLRDTLFIARITRNFWAGPSMESMSRCNLGRDNFP